jgi:PPIC-type PPIASE domain
MRRHFVAVVLSLVAPGAFASMSCGSTPEPAAAPSAATQSSPESDCLALASAPRERKADEPTRITVKHVLVKYAGAERAPESITRSRGQACLRALDAYNKQLERGANFDDVVTKYSDEEGAATRGGTLGEITRDDVAPSFADAAFRLEIDQVSHVVESPFGFHLILRTD